MMHPPAQTERIGSGTPGMNRKAEIENRLWKLLAEMVAINEHTANACKRLDLEVFL